MPVCGILYYNYTTVTITVDMLYVLLSKSESSLHACVNNMQISVVVITTKQINVK